MLNWIVRGLLFAAGVITGLFIAEDAPNFGVVQMMVALIFLALIVAAFAFWPNRLKFKPRHSERHEQ